MANINLNVVGITCGGCEKSIRNALLEQTGVSGVTASHETGVVKIDFDESEIQEQQLKQAIENAGFDIAA
ncbi:MAG: heavy-metal-associated domain-containing protein [Gammaproteobacteria bacterium]|nr:heavy-metal-associated domain-containing protein [Gammaproteobacteria bacterium]MCP4089257.1 heavy-metal-associated domain-containing protein [Gammaproteobacteria bacterium]MCP4275319.1 heavy-metal-associated domain-containing protein [Gammaproteobacteria bacterium]MCP4830897.1 heavy-metal-associated domain-containing protein [Gammaproteobacteria bacterium]MCP4929891.1 heavy-metal-associated domain-containing protein [Gammaproteobacteria bacterium]